MSSVTSFNDTTFAFIDVETTGLNASTDAVVEVACLVMRGTEELHSFSTLVNPGRPIPPVVSAVHGITDADVASAPAFDEIAPRLRALCENTVIVAHNARFDLGFLPHLADLPTICSMRLAQLVVPDAPNYKNQGLRVHLNVSDPRLENAQAHRALADVIVTMRIFFECLRRYQASSGSDDLTLLFADLNQPRALRSFSFGRHRGRPIDTIPTDYLKWLTTSANAVAEDVLFTARRELERRTPNCPGVAP